MKLKAAIMTAILGSTIVFSGCGSNAGVNNTKSDNTTISEEIEKKESSSSELNYDISKEVLKIEDKNTEIYYPQVKDYPGELLMDYMNQSIKKITDIYGNTETYTDVKIDYEITKMDENTLSILFKGTGKATGTDIVIQQSVNLDIKSSNEINYDNFIKDDEESNNKVREILDKKAKAKGLNGIEAEGIRIYFKGEEVVFYYMPLDDRAKAFIELSVPMSELDGYSNTDFGEHPAS